MLTAWYLSNKSELFHYSASLV